MLTMNKHKTWLRTLLCRNLITKPDTIVCKVTALFDRRYRTDSIVDKKVQRYTDDSGEVETSQVRSSDWHFLRK